MQCIRIQSASKLTVKCAVLSGSNVSRTEPPLVLLENHVPLFDTDALTFGKFSEPKRNCPSKSCGVAGTSTSNQTHITDFQSLDLNVACCDALLMLPLHSILPQVPHKDIENLAQVKTSVSPGIWVWCQSFSYRDLVSSGIWHGCPDIELDNSSTYNCTKH